MNLTLTDDDLEVVELTLIAEQSRADVAGDTERSERLQAVLHNIMRQRVEHERSDDEHPMAREFQRRTEQRQQRLNAALASVAIRTDRTPEETRELQQRLARLQNSR